MATDRRPGVGEIHHLTVGVSDMDAAIAFYRDGLGLRKTLDTEVDGDQFERLLRLPNGSRARTVFLQGPSRVGQIELVHWQVPGGESTPVRRPGGVGFVVVSFSVSHDDIWPIHARLVERGDAVWSDPEPSELDGYGTIHAFIVEDPDGNMIEIVSLPSDEQIRALRDAPEVERNDT